MIQRGKEAETKSVFNEGINQIQRIGQSLSRCGYYSKKGLLDDWRWELDYLSRELCVDADSFKFEEELFVVDKLINASFKKACRPLMYRFLDRKERLLRRLQEEAGKGGSYIDSDDHSRSW